MNISIGGPHILLFERDPQLVALLNRELQAAGYEIHTARTAVEVFDAIARYPVRLVLVNLAQAAAARREFWVALDTQRRGRGIQVFTFHCTNIAGYGPASSEDPDDRSHSVHADMEIDGTDGLTNMVNALRSRIAVANSSTTSRFAPNPISQTPLGSQITAPVPSVQPPTQKLSLPTESAKTPNPNPNHTDKIRAVIYPSQRPWSTGRDTPSASGISQEAPIQDTSWSARNPHHSASVESGNSSATSSTSPTYGNTTADNPSVTADPFGNNSAMRSNSEGAFPKESGLAQLSRMLQEHRAPAVEDLPSENISTPLQRFQDESSMQQPVRPNDAPPISVRSMRASPIQDLPSDRIHAAQSDTPHRRSDDLPAANSGSSASPILMSIATPPSAQQSPVPSLSPSPTPAAQPALATVQPLPYKEVDTSKPTEEVARTNATPSYVAAQPAIEETFHGTMRNVGNHDNDISPRGRRTENSGNASAELLQAVVKANTPLPEAAQKAPDNALLLDIVQSLPTMPSPPPQPPQVHEGRATRSLGNVLLEGHLVPQNRLEVALNIQRMLRGVDMNYQLGEILLMFKLLTPDQLLAASLISYGLITPAQISALGRIRQELHAIGLEYDLENLLILFRILTSEQLREVRSGWSG